MITVAEALTIIQQNTPEPDIANKPIPEILGDVLANDIYATASSPPYTNSAMDGFAVRWDDVKAVQNGQSVQLSIIGESQAGIPFPRSVEHGQTIRISTGAVMPDGTDSVAPIEDCSVNETSVTIQHVKKQFQNVRYKGEEFNAGTLLIAKGSALYPPQLAMLASMGISEAPVFQPANVAVISTGTELVPYHHSDIRPYELRDSNSLMLEKLVETAGGKPAFTSHVGDQCDETVRIIRQAAEQCRVLIFSGGVSMGPHDHVKSAAQEAGFTQLFWKIRQKPGKPLFCARRENCLLFGLPGNPVSAFMGFTYYIYPLIRKMAGKPFYWNSVVGKINRRIVNQQNKVRFLQVQMQSSTNEPPVITCQEKQDSYMLSSIAASDGFIVVDEQTTIEEGEHIECIYYPWRNRYGIH